MKDLELVKKILGMIVERNRSKNKLKIHQHDYLLKTVQKFGMAECKMVNVPLAGHFILSQTQCPSSDSEALKMENIPYANVIEIIMYSMISPRPDLAYSTSPLSRFRFNPEKIH